MTGPGDWFSSEIVTALGLALVHFVWQGTAIATLAFALLSLTRHSTTRYALGVCALVLMLAAPVATFLLVSLPVSIPVEAVPATDAGAAALPAPTDTSVIPALQQRAAPVFPGVDPFFPAPDLMSWLVAGWLLGVVLLSLRAMAGYLHLRRMLREQTFTPTAHMLDLCWSLQRRIGLDRVITYLACDWLDTPAALGWLRPVVLLPIASLSGLTQEQLEAVIVHELAHIRRLDFLVNLFQLLAETLFFYHPAVWWLNRRIRAEREYCCD
ncbi:MAG TPA: M56 family metallopeptidase, partial [Rhizomicrobium sp.]|nr:M56 family metallopeptidase [Rhizomicrobium sp.]